MGTEMYAKPSKKNGAESGPNKFAQSSGRVLHLLLMLIAPGVPIALLQFYLSERTRHAAEVAKQEELERSMQELAVKLRRGEGGEALQRLYGIYPEKKADESDENVRSE